ncbi:MAG: hypothetical protein WD669_05295 [Pirellulales bacterium]
MEKIAQDLASFTSFAHQQIVSGQSDRSIDELFDQWRAENASDKLYAEYVAAVRASIDDFKNGDRGTISGEHSTQLRREFGMADE